MAEKLANMVPISVMASGICDNFGDTDRKYFGEHLKNIITVYQFMHIYLLNNISVKSIIISPDNISDLPCNFVRETKVGIISPSGRIATMSVDKNLRVAPQCTNFNQVDSAITSINNGTAPKQFFSFYNVYDNYGRYVGERRGYACALNNLGYYNIDREEGVIVISPDVPPGFNIIMEYISDGVSDGLQLVPIELQECIVNGSKSMFCLDKKDNRAEAYQSKHENQFRLIKRLYKAKPINIYAQLFKTIGNDVS